MSDNQTPEISKDPKFSRRTFFKGVALVGAGAVIDSAIHPSIAHAEADKTKKYTAGINKEGEVQGVGRNLLVIDTVLGGFTEGVLVNEDGMRIENWVDLAVGKKDLITTRLARVFGNPLKEVGDRADWYKVMEKFGRHGREVVDAIRAINTGMGINRQVMVESNSRLINKSDIKRDVDDLGNPRMRIELGSQGLNSLIKDKKDVRVVNLSLLMGNLNLVVENKRVEVDLDKDKGAMQVEGGKFIPNEFNGERVELTSDGYKTSSGVVVPAMSVEEYNKYRIEHYGVKVDLKTPELKIDSGGRQEMMERQRIMREVCGANEDKLFVFAAGNWGEDWTGFENRPENCLVVAAVNNDEVVGGTRGADVAVGLNIQGVDLPTMSSFSTAYISAISARFMDLYPNSKPTEVKQYLLDKAKENMADGTKRLIINESDIASLKPRPSPADDNR